MCIAGNKCEAIMSNYNSQQHKINIIIGTYSPSGPTE